MAPRASALPSIALPPVLDPARDAATVREMLRPKAKTLRDMTPRERRRVRPRPPSELAAQAAVARFLRGFRAALQRQLIDNLSIILSIRQDAIDPHQYAVRFANLEVSVGELEPDLGRDLRRTVVGLEEHTRGELQRVMRVSLEDIGLQSQADEFVRDGVNLVRSVSFEQLAKMRQIVASAAGGQLSQRELAKQILERFDVTKSRARLIARDQVLKFNARASEALQRGAGVEGYFWSTSKDIRVRGLPGGKNPHGHHHQLEGTRQSWNEPPVVDLRTGRREHPGKDYQCLPGNRKITFTSAVRRLYRRWYCGQLTKIVTDSGVSLETTPNHPVLTTAGWKSAQSVQIGDYVIQVGQKSGDLAKGEVQEGPTEIANLFEAFALAWPIRREETVTTQFHGDGSDSHVDIVDVDSRLRAGVTAEPAQRLCKLLFAVADADMVEAARASGCDLQLMLAAQGHTSDGSIRWGSLLFADLVRRLRESGEVCSTPPAHCNPRPYKDLTHCLSLGVEAFRQHFDRRPLAVATHTLLVREWGAVMGDSAFAGVRDQTTSAEVLAKSVRVSVQNAADFREGTPLRKKLCRVVNVGVRDFSGHVYNLETSSNWYASAIVVHNCRCVAIPDTEDLLYGGLEDEAGSVRAPLPEPARGAAPLPAALPTTAFTVAPKALEKLAELNAAEDTTAASYVRYRLEYLPIKDIDVPDAWSQAKLDNIVAQLRAGKEQWPIRAELGDDGKYVIEDGIHRANASRALGLTHVPAIVGEIVRR